MNNLLEMDAYTAGILDTFDPEEVFTYDPVEYEADFDNAQGRRKAAKKSARIARQTKKLGRTQARQERKGSVQLARIAKRKESKLARIAGSSPQTSELLQVDKTSIPTASAKIEQAALEQGIEPSAMAAGIVTSPIAQQRLINYVIEKGNPPMEDPIELAQQAYNLRQMEIGQAMAEPPYMTEDPAEMEYQLMEEEYNSQYLPEVNETGDLENFSNFVDPATWAATKKIAEVGIDKTREARFKAGKKFFGETEAQYKARKGQGTTPVKEALSAGAEEYKDVYTQNWISDNFIVILIVILGLLYAGYYFGKK